MAIQRNIIELLRNRTVIAVAHRLSTLANFDRILVIEHGRPVGEGSPAQLRQGGGPFLRMWQLQAEGLPAQSSGVEHMARPRRHV